MAQPNIVSVAQIYGQTRGDTLTGSNAALVTCASEYVYKINTIIVTNTHGSTAIDVTLYFYDSSLAARYEIASTISVPADTSIVVIDKNSSIYLEEGDKIEGFCGSSGNIKTIISYEAIID